MKNIQEILEVNGVLGIKTVSNEKYVKFIGGDQEDFLNKGELQLFINELQKIHDSLKES